MVDVLLYVLLLALLALAAVAALWAVRSYLGGQSPMTPLFGARPEKRIAVVEHASVDGRRRLILLRRDDVEHLIMTGGPVDVVIETGIGAPAEPRQAVRAAVDDDGPSAPGVRVFGRATRTSGRTTPSIAE
jgi:flagellar protein FliO/FliZ